MTAALALLDEFYGEADDASGVDSERFALYVVGQLAGMLGESQAGCVLWTRALALARTVARDTAAAEAVARQMNAARYRAGS